MKARHHFVSSAVAGGVLYYATGSLSALVGAMVGGFLIDGDHIIDQIWSRKADALEPAEGKDSGQGGFAARYLRRRKLLRLPLVFHSYELLTAILIVAFFFRTPVLTGLAVGYAIHLSLDLYRHHHEFRSPLFYFIVYRMSMGFRRDRLIKTQYL